MIVAQNKTQHPKQVSNHILFVVIFLANIGVSQDIGVALGEFLSVGIWVCPEIKPPPNPDEIIDSSSQSLTFDSYSNSEP